MQDTDDFSVKGQLQKRLLESVQNLLFDQIFLSAHSRLYALRCPPGCRLCHLIRHSFLLCLRLCSHLCRRHKRCQDFARSRRLTHEQMTQITGMTQSVIEANVHPFFLQRSKIVPDTS